MAKFWVPSLADCNCSAAAGYSVNCAATLLTAVSVAIVLRSYSAAADSATYSAADPGCGSHSRHFRLIKRSRELWHGTCCLDRHRNGLVHYSLCELLAVCTARSVYCAFVYYLRCVADLLSCLVQFLCSIAGILVCFVESAAAGSGIPEIKVQSTTTKHSTPPMLLANSSACAEPPSA